MSALFIIKALYPIIRDIAKAASKRSDGGKKVTPEEVEELLVDHLPVLADALFKQLQKRG